MTAEQFNVLGWAHTNNKLCRDFVFTDFSNAFAFMTQVALLAEKADHHPNWSNVYNVLNISLTTHDAGGVTDKDFELAAMINIVIKESLPDK